MLFFSSVAADGLWAPSIKIFFCFINSRRAAHFTLFNPDDEIYYYEFNHKNAVSYMEYKKNLPYLKNLNTYNSEILNRKELKIITGSLYMIGDFMSQFKIL